MARPKTPTKLKLLKGTAQPCRTNRNEPEPETEVPDIPHHLSKEARQEWNRITPLLEAMGLVAQIDMTSLAMYCQSWGDHVKAENMIRRNGAVIKGAKGSLVKSPWVGMSKDARLIAHKFLVEFGLTPASRSRVSGKKKEAKKESKWAV